MFKKCLLIATLTGSVFAANVKMDLNERESANHFHTKYYQPQWDTWH